MHPRQRAGFYIKGWDSSYTGEPIPSGLSAIVMRCLSKAPGLRFASMKELSDALGKVEGADILFVSELAAAVAFTRDSAGVWHARRDIILPR